jgi:hypothetical protein
MNPFTGIKLAYFGASISSEIQSRERNAFKGQQPDKHELNYNEVRPVQGEI